MDPDGVPLLGDGEKHSGGLELDGEVTALDFPGAFGKTEVFLDLLVDHQGGEVQVPRFGNIEINWAHGWLNFSSLRWGKEFVC